MAANIPLTVYLIHRSSTISGDTNYHKPILSFPITNAKINLTSSSLRASSTMQPLVMKRDHLCKKKHINGDKSEEFDVNDEHVEMDHVKKKFSITYDEEGKACFVFQGFDAHELSIILPLCQDIVFHESQNDDDDDDDDSDDGDGVGDGDHDEIEEDEDKKLAQRKFSFTFYHDDGSIGIEATC